ncbi:hypothetical protein CALVIDRAFT_306745 [Calocera viscosa TUFC12733]|uniref:F-box domain-containing protein n=1 Tax=Calocera viscosa (strain TUFC12733) TaxID=1330018 RepID=A0A167IB92_CALVF|nr:hypothetical protein CALVIDRAFT_306745 [Calocera viscosa TUFC12733]
MDLSLFRLVMGNPAMRRRLLSQSGAFRYITIAGDEEDEDAVWTLLGHVPPSQWERVSVTSSSDIAMSRTWLLLVMGTPPGTAQQLRRLELRLGNRQHAETIDWEEDGFDSDSGTIPALLASIFASRISSADSSQAPQLEETKFTILGATIQDFAPCLEELYLSNAVVLWKNLVDWPLRELKLDYEGETQQHLALSLREWSALCWASPRLEFLLLDGEPFTDANQTEGTTDDENLHLPSLKLLSFVSMHEDMAGYLMENIDAPVLECLMVSKLRQSHRPSPHDTDSPPDTPSVPFPLGEAVFGGFFGCLLQTPKLRMLSLDEPLWVRSNVLYLLMVLPSLEVLDAAVESFEDVRQGAQETHSPRLTVLRTGNFDLAYRIDRWTGRQFSEVSWFRLDYLIEHDLQAASTELPAASILKAYVKYLPDAGDALYYVAPPVTVVEHARTDRPSSDAPAYPGIFDDIAEDMFTWRQPIEEDTDVQDQSTLLDNQPVRTITSRSSVGSS